MEMLSNKPEEHARSAAREVLDAFVFSVHGSMPLSASQCAAHVDFTSVLSYFPYALRLLIEVCVQQCRDRANPLWPAYLLKLVDRKDLSGERATYMCILSCF